MNGKWSARRVALGLGLVAWTAQAQPSQAQPSQAQPSQAQPSQGELSAVAAEGRTVGALRVRGLGRTHMDVVRRELQLEEGQPLRGEPFEDGVQRLRNLLVFREVNSRLLPGAEGQVDVELEVKEKWTTLPIARFGGGGGANFFILGAYDINFLGRYLELGGQYENFAGAHSGVVWFRNPRFLDRTLKVGADVWATSRVRHLYSDAGDTEGGFTLRRYKAHVFAEKELRQNVFVGVGAELHLDGFSDTGLSEEELAFNRREGAGLPQAARTVLLRGTLRLGRMDFDDYLVRGQALSLTWEQASGLWGSQLAFHRAVAELLAAWRLPGTQNVALRAQVGTGNARAPQHLFYVGGLDFKRGFLDGQFRGQHYWNLNLEYRLSSLQTEWVVLQHNFFFDVGDVGDSSRELLGLGRVPPFSFGPGLRVLSPRVFRLTLRLDYAFAFGPRRGHGLAFGVQQFF